jgi:cytoplasmic iron level regulating protein YaaA (DUF328/UPF0246 family)
MPNSKALILIICSNNKQKGGVKEYNQALSLTSCLPENYATALSEGRARILRLIMKGGITRDGVRIAELPRNRQLVKGVEFGGVSQEALYLPAAERYRGSFYAQLGSDGPDLLLNARHHVLILSGLYGLVTPSEPVQNYSCHVDDHSTIRRWWTENYRLTDILVAYVKQFGITHILDFTALKSYRHLIDWGKVRTEAKTVFHGFGEQSAGDGLLTPLGYLTRELLTKATESKLLNIRAGMYFETPTDRIYFHSSEHAPQGLPEELEKQIAEFNSADEIVRMGRCVRGILHLLMGDFYEEEMPSRIRELAGQGKISPEVEKCMQNITRWRNKIEHTFGYSISSPTLQSLRADYANVKRWVQKRKLPISDECMEM